MTSGDRVAQFFLQINRVIPLLNYDQADAWQRVDHVVCSFRNTRTPHQSDERHGNETVQISTPCQLH